VLEHILSMSKAMGSILNTHTHTHTHTIMLKREKQMRDVFSRLQQCVYTLNAY
jgi:hypothetical protein